MRAVCGIASAAALGRGRHRLAQPQRACGVDAIKLPGYGFKPEEFDGIARNARETMEGRFFAVLCELTHEDCVEIL